MRLARGTCSRQGEQEVQKAEVAKGPASSWDWQKVGVSRAQTKNRVIALDGMTGLGAVRRRGVF